MTLFELTNIITNNAKKWNNINGIVESGDIYDLNKDEYQEKYSAFCATQRTHLINEYNTTFGFTFFYVDRLTLDKSNKIEIQSNAVQFFQYFIQLMLTEDIDFEYGEVVPFTERFTAECAGAYMNCKITVTNQTLCTPNLRETNM